MLRFHNWLLLKILPAILCFLAVTSAALMYFIPAPPKTLTIATSLKGGGYEVLGKRYRELLANSGVKLEIKYTAGSVENLKLLGDATSGVAIGFSQGGISNSALAPGVKSMGRVNYQPFWIFYRGAEVHRNLQQLKGKRIAVGAVGSGTQVAAQQLFALVGVTASTAKFSSLGGVPAAKALQENEVDAAFFAFSADAPVIKSLLQDPDIHLMNIPLTDALTKIFPYLVSLKLPQAVIDFDQNIPATDVNLVGTTNTVIVRKDLHPQVVLLLAQAIQEVSSKSGIFERAGEFPTLNDPEYIMSESAAAYYKNGQSVFQTHLPFWMVVHVQRLLAFSVGGFAVLFPLLNYVPRAFRFLMRERLRIWYRRLRIIEGRMQTAASSEQLATLEADLEGIDREINRLGVPTRFSDMFFSLKVHINLVRTRLAARRAELRSQAAKAA